MGLSEPDMHKKLTINKILKTIRIITKKYLFYQCGY